MNSRNALLCGVLLLIAVAPVVAHHSFAAQYDRNKPVELKAVVTKLEWMNPHVWIYVEAKDPKGSLVRWECEGSNPNMLARRGIKKDFLKPKEEVTIQGFQAKNGTLTVSVTWVIWPDGRKIYAGSLVPGESAPGN